MDIDKIHNLYFEIYGNIDRFIIFSNAHYDCAKFDSEKYYDSEKYNEVHKNYKSFVEYNKKWLEKLIEVWRNHRNFNIFEKEFPLDKQKYMNGFFYKLHMSEWNYIIQYLEENLSLDEYLELSNEIL